jgi:hypothetical protein
MDGIKVLAFDTGGTVLDWYAGLTAAMAAWARRKAPKATGTSWRTSIAAARCAG